MDSSRTSKSIDQNGLFLILTLEVHLDQTLPRLGRIRNPLFPWPATLCLGFCWTFQALNLRDFSDEGPDLRTSTGRLTGSPRLCHEHLIQFAYLSIQERYNTPRYRTPQTIPLDTYERNPFMACW